MKLNFKIPDIKNLKIIEKVKGLSTLKKVLLSIAGVVFLALLISGYFYFQFIVGGLPTLEELENPKQSLASIIYSANDAEIGRFFKQRRIETAIDSIPDHLLHALVATEDKKFYDHWGVDLDRLFKALVKTIVLGDRQGASTLTMQLSKLLYDLKKRDENIFDTLTRKIREWITAVQIEKAYTKREILEMYLNQAYYGRGAYGVEMAALTFFNKKIQDLSITESAVLVALLKSNVYYDPVRRPVRALRRRNLVLNEMREEGHITREQYNLLRDEEIVVRLEETSQEYMSSIAPYFVEHVRIQMEEMSKDLGVNIYEDGLTIKTTIDTRMMEIANKVVHEHLDYFQGQFDQKWDWRKNRETLDDLVDRAIKNNREYKNAETIEDEEGIYNRLKNSVAFVDSVQQHAQRIEVGFVVMDVPTGEIKVMVGGRDTESGRGLNHVTQIRRQPGSSFKPIIYTVAIDNGLYPAYPILNQPFDYDGWQPTNFVEDNVGGFLTLREAIQQSINLVAARLVIEDHVKLWQVNNYAKSMGIKSRLVLYPAISLGASEVTPLELTSVFGTIANKGIFNEPMSVLSITDKDGILLESFTTQSREAISEETAYIITNMLESVVKEGTGRRIWSLHKFGRPCAGKTGTNGDYKDAWFMGFTPQLVGGVWVGFNDQRISFTGSWGQGSKAATPIWAEFMREVYDSLEYPVAYFEPPASGNVSTVNFCQESIYELGNPKLFSDDCNGEIVEDIIKTIDIPSPYNVNRDTTIRYFGKYTMIDSTAHEAIEILD